MVVIKSYKNGIALHLNDEDDINVILDEIAEKDFILAPNRYIHYHQEEQESYESVKARFVAAIQAVREAEEAFNRLMKQ